MKTIKKQERNSYEAPRLGVHQLSPRVCIAVSLGGSTESYDDKSSVTENYTEESGIW